MRSLRAAMAASLMILAACVSSVSAQSYLEQLEQGLGSLLRGQNPDTSEVDPADTPAYLGLVGDDLDPPGGGVVVLMVYPEGPAQSAGLREGDVIVAVDSGPIRSLDDMAAAIARAAPGTSLRFTVQRDGDLRSLPVTAGTRPAETPATSEAGSGRNEPLPLPPGDVRLEADERATLGVTVVETSEAVRARYGLAARRGAVITAIRPGSPADQSRLPLGGVIVSAAGQRVDTTADLLDVLGQSQPGQSIEIGYYAGNELYRRQVRLAAAEPRREERLLPPAEEPPPRDAPRTRGGRRPVLEGLGRVLGEIAAPPAGPNPGDGRDREEIARLYEQLDRMQQRIEELERRLAELEARK